MLMTKDVAFATVSDMATISSSTRDSEVNTCLRVRRPDVIKQTHLH